MPATGYKTPPLPAPRPLSSGSRRTVERPEQQAHLAMGWLAPRSDDPSGDAVDLLTTILAGTESSRLAQRLRDQERIVSSVTMVLSLAALQCGVESVLAAESSGGMQALKRNPDALIDTFIALPTFLMALAFTFIYGSAGIINMSLMEMLGLKLPPIDFLYSAWGVILAEVTVYTPFIMRPLLAAFSLIEISQIEVASSLGAGPWRIVRQIILPAALPALLAGGSLCLLLTVNEFGIVLFIGAKGVITLPLLVYDKAIQEFDYPTACVIAVVNVGLSLGLYFLYRYAIGRFGAQRAGMV